MTNPKQTSKEIPLGSFVLVFFLFIFLLGSIWEGVKWLVTSQPWPYLTLGILLPVTLLVLLRLPGMARRHAQWHASLRLHRRTARQAELDALIAGIRERKQHGAAGEQRVAKVLSDFLSLFDPQQVHSFADGTVILTPQTPATSSSEFDHLHVTPHGVLIVETKYWKGDFKYGVLPERGRVMFEGDNGQIARGDPIEQVERKAALVRDLLSRRGLRDVPVYALAVSAHAQGRLNWLAPQGIVHVDELRLWLRAAFLYDDVSSIDTTAVAQVITEHVDNRAMADVLHVLNLPGSDLEKSRYERLTQELAQPEPPVPPLPRWKVARRVMLGGALLAATAWVGLQAKAVHDAAQLAPSVTAQPQESPRDAAYKPPSPTRHHPAQRKHGGHLSPPSAIGR